MLNIRFYPESDEPKFVIGALEYQKIWDEDGKNIVENLERISGLYFQDGHLNALAHEGVSMFSPLQMNVNYSIEIKKERLTHELGHRLIHKNITMTPSETSEKYVKESHKILFLILYDAWKEIYGEDFAKKSVVNESRYSSEFAKLWKETLSLTIKQRAQQFKKIIQYRINKKD